MNRVTSQVKNEAPAPVARHVATAVLGALQILAWGSTFYLPAVFAGAIVRDTGWRYDQVVAGLSLGLLVAGLVSPRVGRAIGQRGGRPVLALGALLLALGLAVIGSAPNLACYFAGWAVVGVGMGAGLYDAAFATLGRIYGKQARAAISGVTLLGGFASTVCWPFSAFLVEHFGWRAGCFVYAAIYLVVAVPLYLFVLPRNGAPIDSFNASPAAAARDAVTAADLPVFAILASVLTMGAAILSMMGTHLVTLMQARGLDLTAAVALGMLIGPAAVTARFVETLAGSHYHPIWTMTASVGLVALGACLFLTDNSLFAIAIILYASGNGIGSIAKGTLPLALFGPERYPALVGRLALPIMVAMALAPYLGAVAFERGGAQWTFLLLLALALSNVALVAVLWRLSRRPHVQNVESDPVERRQ